MNAVFHKNTRLRHVGRQIQRINILAAKELDVKQDVNKGQLNARIPF